MKKIIQVGVLGVTIVGIVSFTGSIFAATTPLLGIATSFGILASTYTNTLTGTTITGDVGYTTGPAFTPIVNGITYLNDATFTQAGVDQGTALVALNAESCTFSFSGPVNLSTDTTHGSIGVFTPGVYCSSGAMTVGGPLTLSGSGTYIFRAVGALDSTANAVVTLSGASACDVFWTPTAATTLGANTTFKGTVIANSGITVGANTNWTGRALAFNGTITTNATTLDVPNCTTSVLHVIKTVVNDNGGSSSASDFNLHVKSGGVDVTGSPADGAGSPGTAYTLNAGTFTVSEDANTSYTQSFSGDCNASGNITLAPGEDKTCRITNNDIAPTLHVIKRVVNENGGTAVASDFILHVKRSGTDVTGSPAAGVVSPGIS